MSIPYMGAKLVLEGEKEYREALKKINAELKVNYADMALTAAQAGKMGSEQDALRAKSEALSNAIESQKKKVAALAGQVDFATKEYEEGSAKTLSYQAALLRAQTELEKMETQQAQYTEALAKTTQEQETSTEEADKGTQSFLSLADVTNSLCDAMGIELPPALQSAVNKLDGVSASGAAAITVIGGITAKLGAMTLETSKTADDLLTLSAQTGLTTDELQEFAYASELVDVSTETLQGSLTKLTNNMQTAQKGTGDAAAAFAELGVRVTDSHGNLRDAHDVFLEAIDALGGVENATERDALAMDIFGRSAQQLNPLIEAGSERLRELGDEAHNVGYVMDEETLGSFGALDDAAQKLDKKMDALHNTLAQALLPVLTGLVELIGAIPTPVLTVITVVGSAILVITLVAKAITSVTAAGTALSGVLGALGISGGVATAGLSGMLRPIIAITAAIAALAVLVVALTGNFDDLGRAASSVGTATASVSGAAGYPHNARGSQYWRGGTTWVGEQGPELVTLPRGSRIYPSGTGPQGEGGSVSNTYYVSIDAKNVKEFNDIVRIAENEKTSIRQGVR